MNAGVATDVDPQTSASSMLRTLVLCDLVESTALVERLGDREAAELIRKHDRLARTLADRHGGREIDKTDGFLMMFDRPVQAVAFAIDYLRGLRQLNAAEKTTLSARVGIHVGDVVVWDNSSDDIAKGAKPVEVEGLVKPITSRLMSLALPGQILLSNIAYDLAHRAQGELGDLLESVRWRTHGRYRFRGVPDPVAVFEVGEEGLAPLKAPPWSSKAHREVPFWRRPATVFFEALVVAALIAVPIVMFLRPDPAIAFANRDWVVVGSLHNLTGETVFDDALESALRIGLEQSRYVNVLPDLKVRDTITRMQRDPDKTEVDRAVGSEVAIRDGARALILPTIAEIGGRVRITAEVIDPQTQTTVYSETADGIGKESILPSLDTINSRLRVRLGEALATVSNESIPLEKVATGNLDALRAYSLGHAAIDSGEIAQGILLYQQAIELDGQFARAKVALASELLLIGRRTESLSLLQEALTQGGRLSPSDKLLAQAWLADFTSHKDALEKWKALAAFDPDLFQAQGAYAYYSWVYNNDYKTALQYAIGNTVTQNPNRGTGYYLLGTLRLGMEQYSDALVDFTNSASAGAKFENNFRAAAFAAQRKFGKISEVLAEARPSSVVEQDQQTQIMRIAFVLDQGKWSELSKLLNEPTNAPDGSVNNKSLALYDALLATRFLLGLTRDRNEVNALLGGGSSDSSLTAEARASELFRAWLAASTGNLVVADKLFGESEPMSVAQAKDPALSKMKILVGAELASQRGDVDLAIRTLRPKLDGTEPFAAHVSLMRALAEQKDFKGARQEAYWLSTHRGRAYTEISFGEMFIPYNVAQSNIAYLQVAEYSIHLEDYSEARKALDNLSAIWPLDRMPSVLSERIKRIETTLRSKSVGL